MSHRPPQIHSDRARAMRRDMTAAEELLWQQLRGRQLAGVKFRRQVPLKGYILDFVSYEVRLIIEVDGFQHAERMSDRVRDAGFVADGFLVLRFWNEEVLEGCDFVVRRILGVVEGRISHSELAPSPTKSTT